MSIMLIWLTFKAKLTVLSGMNPAFLYHCSSPKRELNFIPKYMAFGKIFTNTFFIFLPEANGPRFMPKDE